MKGSKRFLPGGVGVIVCALLMSACGGKIPQNGAPALNINTANPLPTGAVGDAYQEGLSATGGLQPYTWTVDSGALPPGLTLTTDGVLSGTPPAGAAGMYNFTVRVTDSQSPVKAYQVSSLALTINPPLSFPVSTLTNAVIAVAYSATVAASGGLNCQPPQMNPCYTYTLAPGSAPLPAGLMLDKDGTGTGTAGTIYGTPTGPIGTYMFIVEVTDSYPTTATAGFAITVTGKIQGNYAFSFNGYNSAGQAFYMAGSFVADGNGNITSGVFDRNGNDSIGAMTNIAITPGSGANGQCPIPSGTTGSVYCVGRPGVTNGSNLGTIVVASALGTYSFSVSVSLVSDSTIILADPNNPGQWGSGVLKTQGPLSGLSLATTSFGFGLFGIDSGGNRYGGAGYFQTDAYGNITSGNGEADINDNGTVQSQAPLTGSISYLPGSTTGRGTATFTIGSTTFDYAFYVIPPPVGKLFPTLLSVQTDAISSGAPATLATVVGRGPAGGGTTTFTNNSLNATRGSNNPANGDLFELNAVATSGGGSVPDISLGLGNFDGNGNITSYIFDENNGGTLTTPAQNNFTGTYSVDSTNKLSGRVTVSLNGVTNNPVWYLVATNTGFVVGTDPNVTAGSFEPQAAPPTGFVILSLFGNFYGGTSNPVLPAVVNEVETVIASPPPPPGAGNGIFDGTYDSSGNGMVLMNQIFMYPAMSGSPGGFCLADGDSCPNPQEASNTTGRMLVVDNSGNTVDVIYLVAGGASGVTNASTKSVTLSTGVEPSLSVLVH
ncbi:MAG: putative Ig domain-containing protein [Candidatus Korobacteraceae bacterium]